MASGIEARVVRDEVTRKGVPVEITDDYYAQDREGTVWYLGEATTEYEHGKPASTEGSFEDGVDGARRGIAMPAHPKVGMRYRQEQYKGHAEDRAEIVSLDERVKVPLRRYRHTLHDARDEPARAGRARGEVLRPRRRPAARGRPLRRHGPRAAGQGRRPNHARLSPPPTSSSARPPPANATVTSRFSCLEERRVPRLA